MFDENGPATHHHSCWNCKSTTMQSVTGTTSRSDWVRGQYVLGPVGTEPRPAGRSGFPNRRWFHLLVFVQMIKFKDVVAIVFWRLFSGVWAGRAASLKSVNFKKWMSITFIQTYLARSYWSTIVCAGHDCTSLRTVRKPTEIQNRKQSSCAWGNNPQQRFSRQNTLFPFYDLCKKHHPRVAVQQMRRTDLQTRRQWNNLMRQMTKTTVSRLQTFWL